MKLKLDELSASDLKALAVAVKQERERRGKKNPANHDPPTWTLPNKALVTENIRQ